MNTETDVQTQSSQELSQQFDATLTHADAAIEQRLSVLALAQRARLSEQTRYAASLAAEYGAEDTGAKAAAAKAAALELTAARVTTVYQRAIVATPTVAAAGWALYGHIYDVNAKPIPKLTVYLVDERGAYLKAYGFVYTDETGAYLLRSETAPEAGVGLNLAIADAKGEPIYRDTSPRTPVVGQAVYADLRLTSQTPIGDPPPPVRETGFPPATNAKP
jgi:hypothetical protein